MLVLTRKLGESIAIGDEIRITVAGIGAGQVRIGVDAPREIAVHRQEVYDRIQEANRRAAETARRGLKEMAKLWRKQRIGDSPS